MKKAFLFLLSLILLTSCSKEIKRHSIGSPFEVLVVCDDALWNTPAGQALSQALETPVPGLPQKEATFKVTRVNNEELSSTNKAFRNIILVDVSSNHSKCEFRFDRDIYASPQIVMAINAPDKHSFGKFVSDNPQVIVDFFTEKEREAQIAELNKRHNKQALALIKEKFGCEMKIPSSISGYKRGNDFLWFSDYNNPGKVEMLSFAVYSYPYTSPDNFTRENFIHKRDSVMMENIPGSEPGQYIQTDAETVTTTDAAYNGKYMSVARGLWYMKNDDMFGGGPFVSHSIVDEENGKVIVVEAFVYAPNKEKRGFMRKLESALYTLKLPADLVAEDASTKENKK
ncbi:MAG: DUF4837 family protein [Bacteroidaceae bacterium]|nr:DUF4837 family protein [Bacteroidaceae bacterium]